MDYLDYIPVSERTWKVVEGYVDVDAGLMMIGDPCYTLPDDAGGREELGKDWGTFCDRLFEEEEEVLRAKGINPYPREEDVEGRRALIENRPEVYHPWKKHVSSAIVTKTGFGDGTYPVTVEYVEYTYRTGAKEKRVKSVTVEFIGDEEDD